MKRIITLFFCGVLALSLCACTSQSEESAQLQCDAFMEVLMAGEWDAVQNKLPMDGLTSSVPEEGLQNGIMQTMMRSVSYEIESAEEQDDGSVIVSMKIENVDLHALLEALPEGISSEEEARSAMMELAESAPRKTFDAQVTFVPVEGQEDWDVEIDVSFANAMTGGLYDLFTELMGEALGK